MVEPSYVRSENEVSELPLRTSRFEILKNMENNQRTRVPHLPNAASLVRSVCAGQKHSEKPDPFLDTHVLHEPPGE